METAVIGCGVIGLTTGILLSRAGHKVTIYCRETPPNLVSNAACAIWEPASFYSSEGETLPDDYEESMLRWTRDSWDTFTSLPGKEYGIQWKLHHEMFREPTAAPAYMSEILPDFQAVADNTLPSPFSYRWTFKTLIIETPIYMARLMQEFSRIGGNIVRGTFDSVAGLFELSEEIVFNCTGLGSRELFRDDSLFGIKGQLLLHEPVNLEFSLGGDDFVVIPRSDALVLGVLYQQEYDTILPTMENAEIIWSVISGWINTTSSTFELPRGLISKEKIRDSIAGLRPYRTRGIRLEAEKLRHKYIVHDYGHAGSGITLSWGCAMDAVRLLESFPVLCQ